MTISQLKYKYIGIGIIKIKATPYSVFGDVFLSGTMVEAGYINTSERGAFISGIKKGKTVKSPLL